MKSMLLLILTLFITTHATAELTSTEDISYNSYTETDDGPTLQIDESMEVIVYPLQRYAGPGKGKNCSCSGEASFYTLDGNKTASGEIMNSSLMTAAHNCLPMGTRVMVCLKKNPKKCQEVRINDRGPFAKNRIIDLSKGAAKKLGFVGAGHAQVVLNKCR